MESKIRKALDNMSVEYEAYNLVYNHGIQFENDAYHIDIRHWVNVYGVSVDYWDVTIKNKSTDSYERPAGTKYGRLEKDMTPKQIETIIKPFV